MYQESTFRADLGNGWYQNPVINQDIPDPAVFRDGDTFYFCGSTGMYYPALSIYSSKDLVNWSLVCHPFPEYQGNPWAPDILKYNGKYYIYFVADGTNYVSVSDHIDHGWCMPIDLHVDHIDPGHCVFEGKRYLFLSENTVVPLSDDGLRVTGEMTVACPPMELPDEWDIEGPFPEAPNLIHRGGWYYLIYATGGTGGPATAHMVACARAKDPIHGPWTYSPYNPMVRAWSRDEKWHCKGHGCMVDDVNGQWWILYHAYENGYVNQGRKVLMEPVVFTEDGWPVIVGGCNADAHRRKPAGEAVPCRDQISDDFTGPLNPLWKMRGSIQYDRACARDGLLTLQACPAEHPGLSHPITMLPGDHSYQVQTTLYQPCSGCEAGVVLMYDETRYSGIGWKENRLTLYRLGKELFHFDIQAQKLGIRMQSDHHYLTFYVSEDGGPYRKLNYVQNTEPMNATSFGDFSSLRAGLFAAGTGEAVFGPFLYEAR